MTEGISVGKAYIEILPETRNIAKGIKASLQGAERDAANSGKRMGGSLGAGIKKGLGAAIALGGGLVAAIGLGSLVKDAANAADAINKFKSTMDFAGYNTKDINKALKATQDYANKTVYELADVQNTTAQLASNGVKNYVGLTEAAGNLNAVAGGNKDTFKSVAMVLTQTAGAGKLTTENWNQLADAIPGAAGPLMKAMKDAGAYTGNFRDAMAKGQITTDEFNAAMTKLGNSPAAKKAATSTQTFEGALGNLQASIVTALLPIMIKLQPVFSKVAGIIANTVVPAVSSLASYLSDKLKPVISSVIGFFVKYQNVIVPIAGGIMAIVVAFKAYQLIMTIVRVATEAFAAVQAALNVVMEANPIGIIILAIIGLVAAFVIAYKKSATFRNIINGAMNAIKNVAIGVWHGISKAISFAWNNIIKPIWVAIKFYVTRILLPYFRLIKTVVVAVFNGVRSAISFAWNRIIKPIFNAIKWTIANVVMPIWNRFKQGIINIWNGIKTVISTVWNRFIHPVLSKLGTFVRDTVKPMFKKAIDGIGSIWNGLKNAAKKPVEFLVNTVYNKGIRAMMNHIPGVHLPAAHFATGGSVFGAGTGTSDSIPAMLSNGEHVLTAKEVKAAGGHGAIYRWRELLANGRIKKDAKTGDLGLSKSKNGSHLPLPGFAKGGALTQDQIKRGQTWAKSQAGKPYVWGAVGPGGYDCSGFMSALTNVIEGRYPYSRLGTSSSFPWAGFKPGYGEFTIGAFTGNPGHVAGTLGGMNVESTNGSVRVGAAARGASNSLFTRRAHLGAAGNPSKIGKAKGKEQKTSDHWWDVVTEVPKMAKTVVRDIKSMSNSGWFGEFKKAATSLLHSAVNYGDNKIPDKVALKYLPDINLPNTPIKSALTKLGVYDNGGVLEPGAMAINMSKKPEAVFNNSQFKAMANNGSNERPKAYRMRIENWETGAVYMQEIARSEIEDDRKYNATLGR